MRRKTEKKGKGERERERREKEMSERRRKRERNEWEEEITSTRESFFLIHQEFHFFDTGMEKVWGMESKLNFLSKREREKERERGRERERKKGKERERKRGNSDGDGWKKVDGKESWRKDPVLQSYFPSFSLSLSLFLCSTFFFIPFFDSFFLTYLLLPHFLYSVVVTFV